MTTGQKIMKYIGMTIAIVLAAAIVGGVVNFILSLLDDDSVLDTVQTHTIEHTDTIDSLDVEINAAEFAIRTGDAFAAESNLKKLTIATEGKTLRVQETTKKFLGSAKKTPKLYLTIPKDFSFDRVSIVTGAGTFTVESLAAKTLSISFGAGKAVIDALTATEKATLDGGAGEMTIKSGTLNNMEFDMGVGKTTLTARILGNSRLHCGVGECNVTLVGGEAVYTVTAEKGLGNAQINGEKITNDTVFGTGENRLDIDGGIGAINVWFRG